MSNTPRTDAAAMPIDRIDTIASRPCNVVHEDVCRQLERELAEVNEKLRQHVSILKSSDAHNNDMFCKLEKERELHSETKSELAEVTKQRDHYKAACDQYSEDEMLCKLQETTKQRDALAEAGNQLLDSLYSQDWRKLPAIRNMRKALAATKGGDV